MHPIQAMTTGDAVSQIVARVLYGILTAAGALAMTGLTDEERAAIRQRLVAAGELDEPTKAA